MDGPEPWTSRRYRRIAFATAVVLIVAMAAFAIWFLTSAPRGPASPAGVLPGVVRPLGE